MFVTNRYTVSFIDPLNNWNSVEAIVEDFADQKNRGKIIEKSVSLEGTTSQNQALRLARFYRDYNSICFKSQFSSRLSSSSNIAICVAPRFIASSNSLFLAFAIPRCGSTK